MLLRGSTGQKMLPQKAKVGPLPWYCSLGNAEWEIVVDATPGHRLFISVEYIGIYLRAEKYAAEAIITAAAVANAAAWFLRCNTEKKDTLIPSSV